MHGENVNLDCIGYARDSEEFRVSSHRLRDFADVLAIARTKPRSATCPAIFAHIPATQSLVECIQYITTEPALHGEHDFTLLRPITPGMRLKTTSTIIGLGKSPIGQLILVESQTLDAGGKTVCRQVTSCIARQVESPVDRGHVAIHRPDISAIAQEEIAAIDIEPDLGAVYAEQSRDYSPYTIDADAARTVGFDAPILHGICTLGLASEAVADRFLADETETFSSLGCRFSAPLKLVPGQSLKIFAGRVGSIVTFSAVDNQGHAVLRNGYAELLS